MDGRKRRNGQTYYYAVVAFDSGNLELTHYPTESSKTIVVAGDGSITTDRNTAVVTPAVEALGYLPAGFDVLHESGVSTGQVSATIIDRTLVEDANYEVFFERDGEGPLTYGVKNRGTGETIFRGSTNYSTLETPTDSDPLFDGIRVFVQDDELAWDSTNTAWTTGSSNWSIALKRNANLGTPEPDAVDLRFASAKSASTTAIFSTPIPVPFEIWNTVTGVKENILVLDENQDGAWNSGEPLYTVTGTELSNFRPTKWLVEMMEPNDPATTPVAPVSGDVAFLPTTKPLDVSDVYVVQAGAASIDGEITASELDRIAVVPNPYIVANRFEQKAHFTGGVAERRIQFINLPRECTIKIYDLRGRHLDTIEHSSAVDNGIAWWDLQTKDGGDDWVAYGIYVYHVEAPDIGETIGRFGVIR